MNLQGSNLLLSAAVLLILAIAGSNAITCYHCNSAYDPRCADPFDSFSLGIIDCNKTSLPEHVNSQGVQHATLCRKTTQKVYGKVRVVRGCGYLTDERDDGPCLKRSGTHDVFAWYCACTTDLCNSSQNVFNKHQIAVAISAALGLLAANKWLQRQL